MNQFKNGSNSENYIIWSENQQHVYVRAPHSIQSHVNQYQCNKSFHNCHILCERIVGKRSVLNRRDLWQMILIKFIETEKVFSFIFIFFFARLNFSRWLAIETRTEKWPNILDALKMVRQNWFSNFRLTLKSFLCFFFRSSLLQQR